MYTFFQVNVARKIFHMVFESLFVCESFMSRFHPSTSGKVTTTGAAESKSSSFDYSFDFTFSSFLNASGLFLDVHTVQCNIYCR